MYYNTVDEVDDSYAKNYCKGIYDTNSSDWKDWKQRIMFTMLTTVSLWGKKLFEIPEAAIRRSDPTPTHLLLTINIMN